MDTLNTGVTVGEKAHICGFVVLEGPGTGTGPGCGIIQKALAGTIMPVFPTAQTGTRPCGGTVGVAGCTGARVDVFETTMASFTSTNSLFDGRLRFFVVVVVVVVVEVEEQEEESWMLVGIFRVPPTETAMAGTVPVPVASMMACSACSRSHLTVSPSDLCPSSRVN